MVKKLFKHEFLAYARVMTVVYIILLTVATAGRVIQFFENDSIPYSIISVFTGIAYGGSVLAAIAFSFVFAIIRFYRNLFTHEGYLSFTLPVTSAQQIWVKAATAVAFEAITVVMILLSGCIMSAGELLSEIIKAIAYLLEKAYEFAGFHTVTIGLELVALLLVSGFVSVLMYDTFISIGQLFKKNRILAAVGAYFVYYIITQVVSTIISVVFYALEGTGLWLEVGQWIMLHPIATIHIGMCGSIVLSGIFGLICFMVIKSIITKKLNLE